MEPYIGITGFTTTQEVGMVGERLGMVPQRVMLGYICSNKRLQDPASRGTKSPSLQELPALVRAAPQGSLPMIHYYTINEAALAQEVEQVFSMLQGGCRAVQLNQAWPGPAQLARMREAIPGLEVVLQVPAHAMEGLSPEQVAQRAVQYAGLAEYALVDPSGGLGKEFDVARCTDVMLALREALPAAMLGVAGGLCAENVRDRVLQVRARYGQPFCIDAEGRLRSTQGLDPGKTHAYLHEASAAFCSFS